jgi:hypothetical protein
VTWRFSAKPSEREIRCQRHLSASLGASPIVSVRAFILEGPSTTFSNACSQKAVSLKKQPALNPSSSNPPDRRKECADQCPSCPAVHLFDLLAGYHLSFAVVEEGEAVPVSRLAPFNLPSKPMVLAVHMSALLGRLVFPHAGAFSGGGTWPGDLSTGNRADRNSRHGQEQTMRSSQSIELTNPHGWQRAETGARCQSPSIIPRNRTIEASVKSYPSLQAFLT